MYSGPWDALFCCFIFLFVGLFIPQPSIFE
jgi:hypothetical protein